MRAGRGGRARERRAIGRFALPLGTRSRCATTYSRLRRQGRDGKVRDSDLLEGKKTVLVQNTIERLDAAGRKRFEALFTKKTKTKTDLRRMRTMMRESGALDASGDLHRRLIDEAVRAAPALAMNGEGRDVLLGLCAAIGALIDPYGKNTTSAARKERREGRYPR